MGEALQLAIMIEEIDIPSGHRPIDAASVRRLAESIGQIGLQHPVTVKRKGERYLLVAGGHRLAAFKKLGREHIPASIVRMTTDEARLWEISENLHRANLSKLERDEQIAEWIKITDRISSQLATKMERGRPESGTNAAARDLGIDRDDAHRAVKVASLSDEAKDAAREAGLDNNRSALLAAAKEETPAAQVAKIARIHAVKIADDPLNDSESLEKQVAALMSAWNRAGKDAREEFLLRIDQPIMDRQYA